MERKYKLRNKRDKYMIEVELDVIYGVMGEVSIGDEIFIVENRENTNKSLDINNIR